MESINKKVFIIALLLALLTTVLVYSYVSSAGSKPQKVEYVNVFVAARTMPVDYKITDADIKQAKLPKEFLNSRAVLNKSEIVGKKLKDSIISGEVILSDRLADESNSALSFRMPEGKRVLEYKRR